jgi:LPS export ABC transporter protein LptC/lipopolysaccharide transport protein LptA
MAPAPRRPPLRAIRRLLLVALVVVVAGVVGLFLFGRAGRQAVQTVPLDEGEGGAPAEDVTLIGEDFDYTYTEGKRPLFRIRGESIRADRHGTIFLDGVGLTLYDEEGKAYEVQSREASFNREQNEGRLRGRVFLRGPNGLELTTPVLQLRDKGRLLVSTRPVQIRYAGAYVARATRLRVHRQEEVFELFGNVTVESVPGRPDPVFLRAGQVTYERGKRVLRAERRVFLRHGVEEVQAQRMTAFLTEDERSLVFLRGLWQVAGKSRSLRAGAAPTALRFSGNELAILMQPGGAAANHVDLNAPPREPALVETRGADGVVRTLRTPRLSGQLEQGALVQANADGGVTMNESGGQPPVARTAKGRRAEARFRADGQLSVLSLSEQVRFDDPEVKAQGDRAVLDLDQGRGEFFGAPVRAASARGRMTGPHLVYTREHGLLQADGGVRAVLEQDESAELAGSPLGEGEGPVWVESREAFWRDQPQGFLFRGDVRAWRGKNLLRAAEVRGDQEGEKRLTASGGVKTLWVPAPEQAAKARPRPAAQPGGKPAGSGEGSAEGPIEVTAEGLLYREQARLLTYTGGVRVDQQARTLACRTLEVELDGEGEAERMTCTGDARVDDPQAGRTIEGEKAVYHLAERRIEMFGEPVAVRDRDGNRVQGRRLDYFVDDGRVEVRGRSVEGGR